LLAILMVQIGFELTPIPKRVAQLLLLVLIVTVEGNKIWIMPALDREFDVFIVNVYDVVAQTFDEVTLTLAESTAVTAVNEALPVIMG